MNNRETVLLVALLNRAGLVQAVEGQVDAWAPALADVRAVDAEAAVHRLIAERTTGATWVVPGDVLVMVRKIRGDRVRAALNGGVDPMPPVDPDDIEPYQAWRKTALRALGDGRSLWDAETLACEAAGIPETHRSAIEYAAPRQIGN